MPLSPAMVLMLASQCAPFVAPETLVSVVRVESAFNPLAMRVNGLTPRRIDSTSFTDAVVTATGLIARGANVDLGLGQINSANLGNLGLTVSDAFDPCRNLHAAGQVLAQAYWGRSRSPGREQAALREALSIYNTGHPDRGFANGYVGKVIAAANQIVPALATGPSLGSRPANLMTKDKEPPVWEVFGEAARGPRSFLISVSTSAPGDQP